MKSNKTMGDGVGWESFDPHTHSLIRTSTPDMLYELQRATDHCTNKCDTCTHPYYKNSTLLFTQHGKSHMTTHRHQIPKKLKLCHKLVLCVGWRAKREHMDGACKNNLNTLSLTWQSLSGRVKPSQVGVGVYAWWQRVPCSMLCLNVLTFLKT